MLTVMVYMFLSVLYIACATGSGKDRAEKSCNNGRNAPVTLKRCISDAVLGASEYLKTDVVSRPQRTVEYEVPCVGDGRCCPGADRKPPAAVCQSVCKEAERACRCKKREERLMRLVRYVDAAEFKRFLYNKSKCMSGEETKGTEGATYETQLSRDPNDKFKLHMSSFLKRWLFLIASLGYSFLRPELHSSDLWSDTLALLPLVCIIVTEVSYTGRKENYEARTCGVCNDTNISGDFSNLCKSCDNKRLMERYNRVKQDAQKVQEGRRSGNRKNSVLTK
eukprot:jgi/Antlo1/1357/1889